MQVRVLPEYPLGIACGGIELRCLKTVAALNKYKKEDIAVKLLDYYNPDDDFDILHLFGNPPSFYEICYHLNKPKKLVISTVLGAHKMPSIKERIAVSLISKMASLAYQRTDYERLKFIFTRANRIICLNDLEKKYLINKFNVTEEKITIVNNAANDNYFVASADLFIEKYRMSDFVLFIGNITKRKNPLILAQILCLLNIKGVFIGHPLGSDINYITKFEQTIKRSPNLLWIKGLDHDDPLLISAYASAKVFCLPSVSETQPQAALEAMSAGTPVILGDFPYAYQPPFEKSIKVNPADKEALISAIKYAMEQNSSNVSRLPDKYRWNAVAEKINHIYFEVSKK